MNFSIKIYNINCTFIIINRHTSYLISVVEIGKKKNKDGLPKYYVLFNGALYFCIHYIRIDHINYLYLNYL